MTTMAIRKDVRTGFIGAAAALAVVAALWGISKGFSQEGEVVGPHIVTGGTATQSGTAHVASTQASEGSVIPEGRTFSVRTQTSINTGRARVGDPFTAVLTEDLYAGDQLVAGAGSTVIGEVAYVARARETRDKAALELSFTEIRPGGRSIPISASVASGEIEDRAQTAERNADIAWTVGGAIAGAVIGNQADGGSRARRSGRTTGALVGGATGLLISSQTGSDFTLRPGTHLVLRLNRSVRA